MMDLSWAQALVTFLTAGAGAYLGSYLKKKGENLATHEDIDKLVDQVRAVTTATKEIEAKISDDVWDRQKRWELKRDALFDVVKKLGPAGDALTDLHAICESYKQGIMTADPRAREQVAKRYGEFNEAVSEFQRASLLVEVVGGLQLLQDLVEFAILMRELAQEMIEGHPEVFIIRSGELVSKRMGLVRAIRNEIEVRP